MGGVESAGTVDEGDSVHPWQFRKNSDQVLQQMKDGGGVVKTLAAFVQDLKLSGLYQHGKFPQGMCPAALAAKKVTGYLPAPAEVSVIHAAAQAITASGKRLRFMWLVGGGDGKVMPKGIALASTKQIVLKGHDLEVLS